VDADLPNAFPTPPAGTAGPRRVDWRRVLATAAAIAAAVLVAWLVFRAYGRPEFLLDFANLRLC